MTLAEFSETLTLLLLIGCKLVVGWFLLFLVIVLLCYLIKGMTE